MAIRFNTTFKDVIGQTYQIQIDDSKYAGSQVDYIAAGEGFELTYETGGDAGLVSPIFASTCSVFMHIRPDIQSAFNSFVADIVASGDENRFTILIYKNTALYWKGKILTEQLVIPDTYYSQATITASDGLGKLKDIAYGDEGGFELDGTDNIITHLNYIFYKLGLFGFGNPAQQFAIVQNWQYNNEAGRMFEKIQIRHEAFKEIKSDGTILPISCYDVLLQILTRFELRIVQAWGIFYLQQLNYLGDYGNKATDFYSSTGSFTSTAFLSYDTSNIIKLAGGSTWFKQPAKSVTSNYVYKDALNGSNVFNTIAQRNTIYYIEDVPAGNGEVVGFGFDFRVKHVGNPTSLLTFNIQYVFRITDGTLFLTNEGGVFQWVADNSKRVKIINQFELEDFATIEVVQNSGFITAELPTSATLLFSWDYELTDAFGMPVSPLGTTTVTPTRSEGAIIYAVGDANEGTITTIANGSTGTGEAIELQTLVIGDQPFLRSIGRLQYYDSTLLNWINTTDKWGYGANESLTIEQLLTREVIALQQFNVKIKSYVLRSVHTANSKINGEIVTRLSLSANSNITNIESFVVEFDRSAITYTSFTDSEQIGGLPSGITPTLPPSTSIQYWQRNTAMLSPVTANDAIEVISYTQKALYAESDTDDAIEAVSSTGSAVKGTSKAGVGGEFSSDLEPVKAVNSSTVTSNIAPTVIHERVVSSAANGFGVAEHFNLADSAGTVATQAKSEVSLTTAAAATLSSIKTWFLRQAGGVLTQVMKLNGLGTLNVLKNYTVSANNLPVPICYFRQSKVKLIQNTAVETTMFQNSQGTLTIPANYLTDGATIRITIMGYISTGDISTGSGQTASIRIKLGGNTLVTNTASLPNNLVLDHVYLDAIITIRGTTGSYYAAINGHTLMLVPTGLNAPLMRSLLNATPTAIDATVDNVIDATYQFGAANAANILNITHATIHLTNS